MAAVTKLPAIFPSEEFLTEVAALRGGERVVTCYACGTCSGSFPQSGTWNVALGPHFARDSVRHGGRGSPQSGRLAQYGFTEGQLLNQLAALLRPAEVVAVR